MEFLTVNETAQLLRVSPITVRRYIASGRLAAERVGRGIRVRREAIEAFITPVVPNSHRTNADQEPDVETLIGSLGASFDGNDEALTDEDLGWDEDEDEACLDDELGEPFTMDDSLWNIVGIGDSGEPNNDVARNKHKYIADAILSKMK